MARNANYQLQHSQNFLVNRRLVRQLVEDAGFAECDTVIEIGPGKGIITRALAERAGHVIAIEKDERIATKLVRTASIPENVTLYATDVLMFPMPTTPYRVFANIPFRHTAAIVGKLTTGIAPPLDARLIVQREAAERFMIGSETTMRAQQLAPFFDVEVLHTFRPGDFSPSPGVECVLLQIRQKGNPDIPFKMSRRFGQFLEVVFSAWQPSLETALKVALPRLAAQDVVADREVQRDLHTRPMLVSTEVWLRVFEVLLDRDDDRVWQRLGTQHARLEVNRNNLDRPTQTNQRRSRRGR